MCGDGESSFRTDGAVLIGLSASIILLILVILIVIISCLRWRKRDKRFQVQLASKSDTAHFLHKTSNSDAGSDDVACDVNM